MCGIAGMIHLDPEGRVQGDDLRRLAEAMIHRGPDDSGCWISADARVGLSHRRLSIVDLSPAGRQPMASRDGSIQLVFNGEIYNFRQQRSRLEGKGHTFASRCDAEVLVHLYEEVGDDMVEILDGDFAFAIWDDRRRRLLLARDRMGVKPLYYAQAGERFLFASEIKALVRSGAVVPRLDEESLYHYLTFGVVPPPRTLFVGVHKLPAGGMLSLEPGRRYPQPRIRRYWEPLPDRTPVDSRDADAQLQDLFRASVAKRMMSDVPVGVLFSGGVDSTLNAAFFKQLSAPERVRTYTVGMAATPGFEDECAGAREMAAALGTDHHEIRFSEDDLLATVFDIASFQDEPLADPVCVPLYFVTKLAKETGTTVLQAGEGADELFYGYDNYLRFSRHRESLWRTAGRLPPSLSRLGFEVLRRSPSLRHRKIADTLRRVQLGQELFLSLSVAFYESEKTSVLAAPFRARFAEIDSFDVVAPIYRRTEEVHPRATFLQKMLFIELQLRLPELLLMRVDKMSMANSVEVRVPFLDRDLVDFSLSVPDSFKLRDGICKEPLKRLAARFMATGSAYAPKRGFPVPAEIWFRSRLGRRMRELLEADRGEIEGIFDVPRLHALLDGGPRTANGAYQLWVILNFLLWRRSFLG